MKAGFTTTQHEGELPWGASFGFSNDVEVALPYDSRTNDFNVGTEWTNGRQMLRVGYTGSWFNNLDDTLVWDSPLRLDDSTSAPGRGRMALWPSNSAQTISAAGYTKFAHRTQLTGFVSYGSWSNDEPLQPFTINPTLPQIALPRESAQAEARVFSTNLGLVSRPLNALQFTARVRHYDYENQIPATPIPEFINYDTSVKASSTGGPEPYAHSRTNFDADAIYTGLSALALTVGYTRNNSGHDFRIFESTGENVLRLSADTVGSQWVTFRAQYELSDRSGSGLDESLLVEIGEQPAMRHYDIADRGRNRFTGIVDVVPNDRWTFSVSGGVGKDDFDDSYFGLQESTFRTLSFAADYREANGLGGGATYNYERYFGFQQSRSASPGTGERSAARLDDGFHRDRPLLLDLRHAAAIRTQHRSARVVRLQLRRGKLPVHGRSQADRCHRPRSFPTSSTSCSNSTSMSGIACRARWRWPSRISTSRSGSTISRSTRRLSTASSSPARSCSGMSIAPTRRTQL